MSILGGVSITDGCCLASQPGAKSPLSSVCLALVCVCGMLWGQSSRETSEGRGTQASGTPFHFWRSTVAVTVGSICLVAGPSVATRTLPATKDLIARLHGDVLNAHDLALQRRGYYEELDVGRMDDWRCHDAQEPEGWNAGRKVFYRERSDFLMKEIVPSVSTVLRRHASNIEPPRACATASTKSSNHRTRTG